MEEDTAPATDRQAPAQAEEAPITESASPKQKVDLRSWWRLSERVSNTIRTWTFTILILFFAGVLIRLIVQEVNDKGYRIQAFRMPEEFAKDGYDGVTTAYLLLDRVNHIIAVGNDTRSIKEVEEYQQSADHIQVQVEVSGVGISPDAIASYINQAMRIKSKSIGGEIVTQGDTLKCFLRISGYPTETLIQVIDKAGANSAVERLIQKSAESVIKRNNPLLLALFYAPEDDAYKDKAIEALRYAIQHRPDQAAHAYARWAHLIYWTFWDTTAAMIKVRKALEIDPTNAIAYRVWAHTKARSPEGEKLLRKSLSLDSTSIFTWNDLGVYYISHRPSRDEEAEACFRKSYELDSTVIGPLRWWAEVLFLQGKFEEANQKVERLGYLLDFENSISLAVSVALNDSLEVERKFRKLKKSNHFIEISQALNDYAFEQEKRKRYDLAFKLVHFSLQLDSTSKEAALPYSTLAELYGLTGDKEGFYSNIEKSIRLAGELVVSLETLQQEPYKSLSSEDRFKRLLAKYANRITYE